MKNYVLTAFLSLKYSRLFDAINNKTKLNSTLSNDVAYFCKFYLKE